MVVSSMCSDDKNGWEMNNYSIDETCKLRLSTK